MLKLKRLQENKSKENRSVSGILLKPALIRIKKDLEGIDLPTHLCEVENYLNETPMRIRVIIKPDAGFYKDGNYIFNITAKDSYPIEAPTVKCLQRIYHPNIDIDGNVCLNLLREDWTPALDIQSILIGILYLFYEPNGRDPLNKDAAKMMIEDPTHFQQLVHQSLRGCNVNGLWYDRVI